MWYSSLTDPIGDVRGRVLWAYDSRGRLTKETTFTGPQGRGTTFAYDFDERDSTYQDTSGVWSLQYEVARSVPNVLMSPLGDTLTYTYDALLRPEELLISNGGSGMTRDAVWNGVGELATLMNSVGGAGAYLAGRYSRVASIDEGTGPDLGPRWNAFRAAGSGLDSLVDSLTFDGWERLIEWRQRYKVPPDTIGALTTETYSFDREGNIFTPSGAETYDRATNRLTSRSDGSVTWTYTYDAAGNLTIADTPSPGTDWAYTYDALNRLTSAAWRGTLVARYGYDVLGRRIVKRVYSAITGGETGYTRFVYHGNHVAYETDSSGTAGMRYTWGFGIDDLVGVKDATGNRYTTVQDPLHSVRGLVATNGTWKMSQRFSPYGTRLARDSAGTIPKLRYQWTGREFDAETGLYFYRSRYYDPGAKRFVQEDRKGFLGGRNLYSYVQGQALQQRDPFGEDMCFPALVFIGDTWEWHPEDGPRGRWWHIYDYDWQMVCVSDTGNIGGGGGGASGEEAGEPAEDCEDRADSDTTHTECQQLAAAAQAIGNSALSIKDFGQRMGSEIGGVTGIGSLVGGGRNMLQGAEKGGYREDLGGSALGQARHFAASVYAMNRWDRFTADYGFAFNEYYRQGANAEDYNLSVTAFDMLDALKKGTLSLSDVGSWILANVCER